MSKRVLTVLLAVMMAVGIYTAVASAGVEGSFTFDMWMYPQTTAKELSKMDIDFEGLLNLDITLSGLTFGNNLAIGIAGIEHYVASLTTTLGALDLKDEFAFAAPYIGCPYYLHTDTTADTNCYPVGSLLFVKKRVDASLTLGGLTFDSLIMFEDINFPVPYASTFTDTNSDGKYTSADQDFAFGSVLTISGTTVSGITVTSSAGINADFAIVYFQDLTWYPYFLTYWYAEWPENAIKKYSWDQVVMGQTLEFTKEFIAIENVVPFEGLTLNSYTVFTPSSGFTSWLQAKWNIIGIDVSMWLETGDITSFAIDHGVYSINTGNFGIYWQDMNGDLTIGADDYVTGLAKLDIQMATFYAVLKTQPTYGFTGMTFAAVVPVGGLTFEGRAYYIGKRHTATQAYVAPTLSKFYFKLSGTVGGLDLTAKAQFHIDQLDYINFSIKIPFSA